MKDINEVLRRKQTQYAQLAKHIEMLQQAAEKLREVAPLLADDADDDSAVLTEVDDDGKNTMAARASAQSTNQSPTQSPSMSNSKPGRTPRWP
ncbi:MAG: hypothetical protein WBS24_15330 [Terriglobales bacterium]